VRLDFFLERFAALAVGGDDQNGVVTGNGAGDLGKFCTVNGGGKGLRAARRSFENEEILRWADIEEKFTKRASEGRKRGALLRQHNGGRAIAFPGFDQLEFLEIAGERGLGNAHALLRQAAAEMLLIGDPLGGDQAEDLAVAKCLCGAHSYAVYIRLYIYTIDGKQLSNKFGNFFTAAREVAAGFFRARYFFREGAFQQAGQGCLHPAKFKRKSGARMREQEKSPQKWRLFAMPLTCTSLRGVAG
jgi:hypothetical protein